MNYYSEIKIRQFYLLFKNQKWQPLAAELTWSHYLELLPIKNINEINYYKDISINQNLSRNKLREKIRNKEYQRLDDKTKLKLINKVNKIKKQDIGQIQIYMNYINKNVKSINQDNTIGIIVCKENDKYIIKYSTDTRIYATTYELI